MREELFVPFKGGGVKLGGTDTEMNTLNALKKWVYISLSQILAHIMNSIVFLFSNIYLYQ